MNVRLMTEADLAAADQLRQLAGWNQAPEDWRRLLTLEPEGCFVAVEDPAEGGAGVSRPCGGTGISPAPCASQDIPGVSGRSVAGSAAPECKRASQLLGTVTTTSYGLELAWIGMMLVHPEQRRRSIATKLMVRAVEYLRGRGVQCIRLDATPAGYPVYEKLGFVPEWTLTRWQQPGLPGSGSLPGTRAMENADWPTVEEIDRAAFGVARAALLHSLAADARLVCCWPAEGTISGFGMLRPGVLADYVGPAACNEPEGAAGIIRALVGAAGNRPLFWDVPNENEPAQALAKALGFTPARLLTRMRLGPKTGQGGPCAQFAIADPAVG